MKINRIDGISPTLRGDEMAKKKNKGGSTEKDKVEISSEALATARKNQAVPIVKPGKAQDVGAKAPISKPSDLYKPSRGKTEAPLRQAKIEHAKMMIQNNSYNEPQVLEAIIDRLVLALKE